MEQEKRSTACAACTYHGLCAPAWASLPMTGGTSLRTRQAAPSESSRAGVTCWQDTAARRSLPNHARSFSSACQERTRATAATQLSISGAVPMGSERRSSSNACILCWTRLRQTSEIKPENISQLRSTHLEHTPLCAWRNFSPSNTHRSRTCSRMVQKQEPQQDARDSDDPPIRVQLQNKARQTTCFLHRAQVLVLIPLSECCGRCSGSAAASFAEPVLLL